MNCIIVDDEEMSRHALKQLVQRVDFLNLIKVYDDPIEAINTLKNEKIDLMFLDIQMPNMSGMDLIKSLAMGARPMIILTTSHTQYAIDAFEYNVVDYLVKPVMLSRFFQAVTKARDLFENPKNKIDSFDKDYFFVKHNSVMHKLPIKDILWMEAMGDYITINTVNRKFILHLTLKAIEPKIPADKFVRVHRSFIVAVDNITSVADTTILINNKLIPVGAIYKESFMKRLNLLSR